MKNKPFFTRNKGGNSYGNQYGVYNANQIKSAAPITRDEEGNIIPLSRRFNEENNDIRFRYRPNQKGYGVREDGTAASNRALAAEEEGRFTAGKFRQNYHISKAAFDVLRSLDLISSDEWHHTGKSMKKSDYFGWADEDTAERYAEHKRWNLGIRT